MLSAAWFWRAFSWDVEDRVAGSTIVGDFDSGDDDLLGIPHEADAPLLVDADAPLALNIARQLPADFTPEDFGSLTITEAFNHGLILTKTRKWSKLDLPAEQHHESGSASEGFVRCCYATAPELIAKAMDLMEEFVNEVRGGE